jgi:hypothetical protein
LHHHIYGIERPFWFFGSDGCEFESRRGRLYLAVILSRTPIYGGKSLPERQVFMLMVQMWCSFDSTIWKR